MKVYNHRVSKNRMRQFHEILVATGGHYLSNPILIGEEYIFNYSPGDYRKECELWELATTDLVEINRTQWWRRLLRRFKV